MLSCILSNFQPQNLAKIKNNQPEPQFSYKRQSELVVSCTRTPEHEDEGGAEALLPSKRGGKGGDKRVLLSLSTDINFSRFLVTFIAIMT